MNIRSLVCVAKRSCVVLALAAASQLAVAQSSLSWPSITTFDAPGGSGSLETGCSGQCGTFPTAIALDGTIVGNTVNANSISHGFLRTLTCQVYNIDPPGSTYTAVSDVSPEDAVTGYFTTAKKTTFRGFLRDAFGNFAVIEVPGADKGTFPEYFTPNGEITGHYSDDAGTHGFLVDKKGNITKFTVLNSALTMPQGINAKGTIAGYYSDGTTNHGFVRDKKGAVTSFDPPGSSFTISTGIDASGEVTGYYLTGISQYHGFVRSAKGTFKIFDPPNSQLTIPQSIDVEGAITGEYFDPNSTGEQGFLRWVDGSIDTFSVPATAPTNATGTMPSSINALGSVTGTYIDTNLQNHGFVRSYLPQLCLNNWW